MDNIIEVRTSTTYAALSSAKAIIDGFGGRDCVKAVKLNTKTDYPDPFESSEEWPVRLICVSDLEGLPEFEIRVLMMTSGYDGGSGPANLIELLDYAGFYFDPDRIYNETINETWTKDDDEEE